MNPLDMETRCTATDSFGFPCMNNGQPTTYGSITLLLCEDCKAELRRQYKKIQWNDRLYRMWENGFLPNHSSGFCYVILLPDGAVKIGHVGPGFLKGKKTGRLYARWRAISNDYKGFITPLGVLEGGETLEGVLHSRWDKYRLPGDGERFSPEPELLNWASTLGIAEGARSQVDAFTDMRMKAFQKEFTNA